MGESKRRERSLYGEREIVFDSDYERMTIKDSMDVEPTLARVAHDQENQRPGRVGRKVGTLPAVVVVDLINRGIFYDPDAFDRWWHSFEANPWKSWKGRV